MVYASGSLFRNAVASLQLLGVLAVDKGGEVTTVIQDQVELLAVLESVQ